MSKKISIIFAIAVLGLLSASTMWFMQHPYFLMNPMFGGAYMGQSGATMGMMGSTESKMRGIMPGEMDLYETRVNTSSEPLYYPYPSSDALEVTDRSIQKYSYHSLVVDDVSEYLRSTRDYILSNGGIVLSYTQDTQANDYVSGNISAKVPVNKFDEVVSHITQGAKKVLSESVSAQDVTGQVVSVAEKLQSLEDAKATQEIALEEATTAIEKRRIQLEIDRLNRQIEQVKKSQENVEDTLEYATINISVANKEYYFNGGASRPFTDVLREAWYSLKNTGIGLAYFLIWVAVYAIIWIPVLLLARWIWGKVRPAASKLTTK